MAKKKEVFLITTRWRALLREEQIAEVRAAMSRGMSNASAARVLGTTPGIVAGIRWRQDIASTHPVSPRRPSPTLKLASSEERGCAHRYDGDKRCPYEPLAGSLYCALHQKR